MRAHKRIRAQTKYKAQIRKRVHRFAARGMHSLSVLFSAREMCIIIVIILHAHTYSHVGFAYSFCCVCLCMFDVHYKLVVCIARCADATKSINKICDPGRKLMAAPFGNRAREICQKHIGGHRKKTCVHKMHFVNSCAYVIGMCACAAP